MKEFRPSVLIFYTFLISFFILFERLYKNWFIREIWAVILAFFSIFIILFFYNEFINGKLDKLDDRFEREFNLSNWLNRFKNFFALVGIISTILFFSKKETSDIIILHPEDRQITYVNKDNWGLNENSYDIKFINGTWKYKIINDGQTSWTILPEVQGVFDKDYLNSYYY